MWLSPRKCLGQDLGCNICATTIYKHKSKYPRTRRFTYFASIRKSHLTTLCAWKSVESTSRSESSTVVKNNLYLRRLRPNYHFSGMGSSLGRRFDLRQLRPEVGTTTRSQPKQYQISFSNLSWFGRVQYALPRVVVTF